MRPDHDDRATLACNVAGFREKIRGSERDLIIVFGAVSDTDFARYEESFLLGPRRLFVATSRARLLSVVVCNTALFGIAPEDSDQLSARPVWAHLFAQAVGRNTEPAWARPLGEFVGDETPTTRPCQCRCTSVPSIPTEVSGDDAGRDRRRAPGLREEDRPG